MEFDEPKIEMLVPQPASQEMYWGHARAMTIQEDMSSPGKFFIATYSTLFHMYRNKTGNWTTEVLVGTDEARCIDGR